ncbi:MAG: hypothetical protein ACHREM_15090 [Polyangiales bacterium]
MSLGDLLSGVGEASAAAIQRLGTAVPQVATYVAQGGQTPTQKYLSDLNARAAAVDGKVQGLASQNQAAFNDLVASWNNFYQGQWQPFLQQATQMPDDQAVSMGRGFEGQIQQWEGRVAYGAAAPQEDVKVESYITQLQAQIDADDLAVRHLPDYVPGHSFTQFKADWTAFMQGAWYGFVNNRSGMTSADKLARATTLSSAIAAWTTRISQAQTIVIASHRAPPPPVHVSPPPPYVDGSNKGAQITYPPQPAPLPRPAPRPAPSGGGGGGVAVAAGLAGVAAIFYFLTQKG